MEHHLHMQRCTTYNGDGLVACIVLYPMTCMMNGQMGCMEKEVSTIKGDIILVL